MNIEQRYDAYNKIFTCFHKFDEINRENSDEEEIVSILTDNIVLRNYIDSLKDEFYEDMTLSINSIINQLNIEAPSI